MWNQFATVGILPEDFSHGLIIRYGASDGVLYLALVVGKV